MKTIAYSSPFVPPEWIAAHNLQPSWLPLRRAEHLSLFGVGRGICPYAGALLDAICSTRDAQCALAGVVMTTACDQMRFAAALVEQHGGLPVFLLNMPSTWATAHTRDLYRDELARLGRFLVGLGGEPPSANRLSQVMIDYDGARAEARQTPLGLTAGIPLALLGGPLLENDHAVLDLVEQAGGRVVLDATEGGQRTLPAEFRRQRLLEDPLEELADAYFHAIPDVFRRPNDGLYEWLARQFAACEVRGVLLRRYVCCDLWHAEVERLRQWSPVPLLDIDLNHDDHGSLARTLGRVEAFLEMLE